MGRVVRVPRRGDVWEAEFDPVRGREQSGRRPAVVVSADRLHQGTGQLAYVLPLTRTDRGIPWHVALDPPEGGVKVRSFIMCDQLRIFAFERLLRWRGSIDPNTMAEIEDYLRVLLGL